MAILLISWFACGLAAAIIATRDLTIENGKVEFDIVSIALFLVIVAAGAATLLYVLSIKYATIFRRPLFTIRSRRKTMPVESDIK